MYTNKPFARPPRTSDENGESSRESFRSGDKAPDRFSDRPGARPDPTSDSRSEARAGERSNDNRERAPFRKEGFRPDGPRPPRGEGRPDRDGRPFREGRDGRPPRDGRDGRDGREGFDPLTQIRDVDRDLIRLIARRARLIAKLSDNGITGREKELRTAWEQGAASVSRDPRFIRQMFTLLQEVEVAPEESTAYNLAPVRQALDITLPAPASSRQTRLLLTLAAASASQCTLSGVLLNTPVMECLKMFNQVGASLRWEDDGRIDCTGTEPTTGHNKTVLDKVVHAGDDLLNVYLLLFQMVTRPARLKIIGESALRFVDLTALRRFLPLLGTRLTCLVPGQEGLPARIEASALLPDTVPVPADLPIDAVVALLLATPFWDRPVTVSLADHPQAQAILDEVLPLYTLCGVQCEVQEHSLCVTPGNVVVPPAPVLDMDLALCGVFLALPAFCGGTLTLTGRWSETDALAKPLLDMLSRATTVTVHEDRVSSACSAPMNAISEAWDCTALPQTLIPLALAVTALASRNAEGAVRPCAMPRLPEQADAVLVESFLNQVGLVAQNGVLDAIIPSPTPWASPSMDWALGLALGAFVRPHIKLANPSVVTSYMPAFWTFYNSLPAGNLERKNAVDNPAENTAKPARRRVLAGFMPASEMPEPVRYEDEE